MSDHDDLTFTEPVHLDLEFRDGRSGGTILHLRQGLFPAAVVVPSTEGWHSSFTRLDALLATTW
ncbi:hypothetical protein BKD30_12940 [Tersicoccus phoenicis]|uniref:Uncharacterized protein n=1 Tax=Tersicoccus phoenicis TaxID=554083 RepID=A0A1R1L6U0_9MICC|nr:hypothetical protein [Tersicoccus phoenicis]OMH23258.1 hypothetical protein BKD30_12940 [Tersicoccus phoenicis]